MDKEIEDTMEGWNQEQENKKKFDEKFNNAHKAALESKKRDGGGQDGSSNMGYYGASRRSTGSRGRMGTGRMK